MKVGERTICPVCRQEIIVQEKVLMDGWTAVGKVLFCPMCETHLSRQNEASLDLDPEEGKSDISALSALLGEDDSEAAPTLDMENEERHFCRDCSYIIVHPFMNRCTLHGCEVNPMSDCDDFIPRGKEDTED